MMPVQRLATSARPLAEVLVDQLRAASRGNRFDRLRHYHPSPATGPAVTTPVNAARVIRAALLTAAWPNPPVRAIDLAGSALLLCAADGNAAALAVLRYFRRRFAAPKTASARGEV